jgi:hypothetical protein
VTQAHLFGAAGRTDAPEVLADLEVDYTPVAVAVQLLLGLQKWACEKPRILDPAAGSGCWGRAARAVFGADAYLVGVEPRASERANVVAAYNEAHQQTLADFLAGDHAAFDLIVGNPPFSAFADFWPGLFLREDIICPSGGVALYGLSQWGQSADASANLRKWSPSFQWRLGGRPAHRANGQTDAREYSLWGWDIEDLHISRDKARPTWMCTQLPELPTAMRRWSPAAVPGTYPIDQALVDEIRTRYL